MDWKGFDYGLRQGSPTPSVPIETNLPPRLPRPRDVHCWNWTRWTDAAWCWPCMGFQVGGSAVSIRCRDDSPSDTRFLSALHSGDSDMTTCSFPPLTSLRKVHGEVVSNIVVAWTGFEACRALPSIEQGIEHENAEGSGNSAPTC